MPKFTNPFAHLMGLNKSAKAAKGRRAEEEEDERDENAEDDEQDENAEDEERDENAEDSDDDENADDDEDDSKAKKAKKAKGKKADDDSDDADASVAKGRRMEKKRIASILGCKAAAARPDLAAYLACQTSVPASSAIEQLNITVAAMPAPAKQASTGRVSLDERMGNLPRHHVGQDAEKKTGPAAGVDALVSLYNKHLGKK